MKKIVVLDGYTVNPGDLSWEPFEELVKNMNNVYQIDQNLNRR